MTFRGRFKRGVVVLERGRKLPDGTAVMVTPVQKPKVRNRRKSCNSLADALLKLAGAAGPGLPRDLAENHDHYLHGTPKK